MNRLFKLSYLALTTAIFCADDNQSIDQKWKDLKNNIVDKAKSTGSGTVGFLKGMGQSFGGVTPDFHYSYQVWNDSSYAALVAQQKIIGLMGTNFSMGDFDRTAIVQPFTNTGEFFFKRQLYFIINIYADPDNKAFALWAARGTKDVVATDATSKFIADWIVNEIKNIEKYRVIRREIYPWSPNDNNVYYYRVYADKEKIKAEYLGVKASTSDFLATFYNNTQQDVQLTFIKNKISYTVTLAAQSFNNLQALASDATIRPATTDKASLVFANKGQSFATIPILPQGIANVTYNENSKKFEPAGPMLYTYEIYADASNALKVAVQGLSIGNFTQPISGVIRDINPVNCHVWRQSAAQVQEIQNKMVQEGKKVDADPSVTLFDTPDALWVSYKTIDYTYQNKIQPGSILNFTLIRPQIKEKEATLYGVLLNTQDDAKAKKFLDRLHAGKIGQGSVYTQAGITGDKIDLSGFKPNIQGQMSDANPQDKESSGVIGYLLFSDIFLPVGVDSGADFYYIVPPVQLRADQLVNAMYLDDNYYTKDESGAVVVKPDFSKQVTQTIMQWMKDYQSNKAKVSNDVAAFFAQYSNKALFKNPEAAASARQLTDQGKHMLDIFMMGPISLANPPVLPQAGINYYVYGLGSKPDSWPSASK